MKIRFWGVRGSIPVPGPGTVKYGGNTTCIEVRTDEGELIILDAGSGIFPLAQSLLGKMPLTAHLFITHSHWDHIQGLPFFIPMFIPGNRLRVHGARDFVSGQSVERVMEVQMQYSYFPVREAELKADIAYRTVAPEQVIEVGSASVTSILLNHPVINFGYRIDANGKSMVFTGDHEPYYNIYDPADDGYADYQAIIEEKQQGVALSLAGADLLVADASYTAEEYAAKKGWGHGTYDSCIDLAKQAGAKILVCTHHEPTRSDAALEREFDKALARHPRRQGEPEYRLAREGEEIEI